MEEFTKVQFSNLDKILYPESKVTKSDVIRYYIKMAPRMLGILKDRPLVLTRFPNGVAEKGFYEKERPADTPSWVKTFTRYSDSAKREIDYVVCNNLDTLVWLANLAALELHMTLSKIDDFKTRAYVKSDILPFLPFFILSLFFSFILPRDDEEARAYSPSKGTMASHPGPPQSR